ncbi:hypothetical protein ACIGG9_25220 [Pseudonocardia alni]|jgi:hypothetical protein|uniref:hypothetical protein n=1 Tax=Pseudonocardia alni TaxID=33907 RepID=UPI000A680076
MSGVADVVPQVGTAVVLHGARAAPRHRGQRRDGGDLCDRPLGVLLAAEGKVPR